MWNFSAVVAFLLAMGLLIIQDRQPIEIEQGLFVNVLVFILLTFAGAVVAAKIGTGHIHGHK